MNRIISYLPDLAQRVEKLEKANRRLKLAGVLALTLVGCLLLLGVASPKRTVEAEAFILLDANGEARAVLATTAVGPQLALFDANGDVRAMLGMTAVGPQLALHDATEVRALLGIKADGAVLALLDANTEARAVLATTAVGPQLALHDANGKLVFSAPR